MGNLLMQKSLGLSSGALIESLHLRKKIMPWIRIDYGK